jgi:putative ABC transport system permease protein
MTVVLRTTGDPGAVVPALRSLLRATDPSLPLYNVRSMDELLAESVARARVATLSLGGFALLALLLAAVGLYGVIAHATRQREREIGIRMALGADTGGVLRMVLGQGMRLVLGALVLGALGAFALTRLLQGLVFGVTTTDPLTFATMIGVLTAAALAACLVPARRAAAIQPVDAIRTD